MRVGMHHGLKGIMAMSMLVATLYPASVWAIPFGGQITNMCYCFNDAIYTELSGPRGGQFAWTPSTRTYQNSRPSGAGQWMLGHYGHPYFCIFSVDPFSVVTAMHVLMQGSSVPVPGAARPTGIGGNNCLRSPGLPFLNFASNNSTPAPSGSVVISEVYYSVDSAHGTDPTHEWFEIYNGTNAAVSVAGWTFSNAAGASAILPANTSIPRNSFLIVNFAADMPTRWGLDSDTPMVTISQPLPGGLAENDALSLRKNDGTVVDSVSWGSNTSAFSPAVPAITNGSSLSRTDKSRDTNAATDWTALVAPTPGG